MYVVLKLDISDSVACYIGEKNVIPARVVFRPRQTRQLLRAVDLKGRLLSCQSY